MGQEPWHKVSSLFFTKQEVLDLDEMDAVGKYITKTFYHSVLVIFDENFTRVSLAGEYICAAE